ncbi:MAG: Gfo/Idh/MocA family oxidoreductase [Candidatus Hydrogenedentes bacterium]|nr:Gfo/Idh/MocA family oxidoreductase [Candidatus Hydrogenedentota bacterium]
MKSAGRLTRRNFLATTAALAAGPLILKSHAAEGVSANDRINVAYIGVGRRAQQLMDLPKEGRIVAYSDVFMARLEEMKAKNPEARIYQDYREMLASPDIDAVVIATPDHWHALHTIHACEAGKDVYVEKPLSLTVHEGRAMVDAARKHGRIVQTGSQQRSMPNSRMGCELIRNGRIGKVSLIHGANYPSPWDCDLPEQPVPEGLNWDMWCGQTEPRGYHLDLYLPRAENRKYPDGRPYGWISYTPYSGGEMTGWGAHGLDLIQWALGEQFSGPAEVWAEQEGESDPVLFFGQPLDASQKWPEGKALTCPVHFRYASGVEIILDGKGPGGGGVFEGESGRILVDRERYVCEPIAEDPRLTAPIDNPLDGERADDGGYVHLYRSDNHMQNWFDCIRTRKLPIGDVEVGHRAATMCHLGNIARWTKRRLQWDPGKEAFINDQDANKHLARVMRSPWTIA